MKTNLEFKSDSINITPNFPCLLTGMQEENFSSGVFSELEANIMAFKNIEKNVFIISLDTLFITNELKYFEEKSYGITCNRRRKARRWKNYFNPIIAMEPNLNSFVDEKFKILNIYNLANHKIIGTIWSFPCHSTNFPDKTLISSEFPGEVRNSIRKIKYCKDV